MKLTLQTVFKFNVKLYCTLSLDLDLVLSLASEQDSEITPLVHRGPGPHNDRWPADEERGWLRTTVFAIKGGVGMMPSA